MAQVRASFPGIRFERLFGLHEGTQMTLKRPGPALAGLAFALVAAQPAQARITRIVIDRTTALTGQAVPYQTLAGRAFGEIDPSDPHNSIITEIELGKDADGTVR